MKKLVFSFLIIAIIIFLVRSLMDYFSDSTFNWNTNLIEAIALSILILFFNWVFQGIFKKNKARS